VSSTIDRKARAIEVGKRAARRAPQTPPDKREWLAGGAALALAAWLLSPILSENFIGDDSVASVGGHTYYSLMHASLWHTIADQQLKWIVERGRFFPLSAFGTFVFYFVNGSAPAYKFYMVALMLVNLGLFGLITLQVTRSKALGLLAILVTPLLFQMKYGDDSLTTSAGLLQVIVLLVEISLICFVMYLDNDKKGFLVGGVAAYVASMLTYEIGFPFFILFFLIALFYPTRRTFSEAFRKSLPYTVAAGGMVLMWLGLHAVFHVAVVGNATADAYAPNLNLLTAGMTLLKQTSAAFPLSYAEMVAHPNLFHRVIPPFAGPLPGFVGTLSSAPIQALALAVCYAGMISVAFSWMRREVKERVVGAPGLMTLVATGACLLVLPSVLVSLSPKYQTQVDWGYGYLPVYASWFGMAALICAAIYALLERTRKKPLIGVIVTTSLLIASAYGCITVFGDNSSIVKGYQAYYGYPRELVTSALKHGVMNGFPSGSALMTYHLDWTTNPGFFALYGGKTVSSVVLIPDQPMDKLVSMAASSAPSADGATYYFGPAGFPMLDFSLARNGSGWVTYGTADAVKVARGGAYQGANQYVSAVYLSWDPHESASGVTDSMRASALTKLGLIPGEWRLASAGDRWALYVAGR
jgi:hypothetical protein